MRIEACTIDQVNSYQRNERSITLEQESLIEVLINNFKIMLKLNASLKRSQCKYVPIQYQIIEQKMPKITELHGDKIYDYYDWLKEDSERKKKILEVEDSTLDKYINLNTPNNNWNKIKRIYQNPIDYEYFSDVQYRNWHIFYRYLDFSRSIYKPIFRRVTSLIDSHPHVVFDSNTIFGTVVDHKYSPNGKYCAFTIDRGEPNSFIITVINVETGNPMGNNLQLRTMKKIAWSGDSDGFFVYYDPEAKNCPNLFYHFIDEQLPDIFIEKIQRFEIHRVSFHVSDDYKYLILCDCQMVSIAPIESLNRRIRFKPIFQVSQDIFYEYVGNDGEFFTFLTNDRAPRRVIVEIEIGKGNPVKYMEIVVPENLNNHGVLQSAFKNSAFLFLIYIENVQNTLYLFSLVSRCIEYKVELKNERFTSISIDKVGFFLETQSYKIPRKVYRIDFNQLQFRPSYAKLHSIIRPAQWKESKIPNSSEIKLKTKQDSFISFDGTRVPMTIIQKNNDGNAKKPCLVFAYGGFGDPILPIFKLLFVLFIELFNGVIAIFHIRGGGELGDSWLVKACEAEKCFEDLMAGVEYLKRKSHKYRIDTNKIAFHSASHGGLVGAVVLNRKRDLFRSFTIQNANLDLINDLPRKGSIWGNQYGDLKQLEYYNIIKRYAPLLHIRKSSDDDKPYPPTLIIASKNDETVGMENSLKYLAHRRQEAISSSNVFHTDKPTLLKLINSGGHHYEAAEKNDYIDTVFVKLKFLAESMELKFDKKYQ